MQQFIDSYIGTISGQYYIHQVIAITLLIVYGVVFMMLIRGKELSLLDFLLSYPIALSLYSISGYFLLSTGIMFSKVSMPITMIFILVIVGLIFRKNIVFAKDVALLKKTLIFTGIMVALGLVATSGIIPVSATNDSMYFFSEYPRALVYYGKIKSILDNFLTDASQGIAIIGTIPFFYGFDEIYGIQTLLNINFIALFAYAVYEYSSEKLGNKKSVYISIFALVMLMTSMPFVLMSRWFMANAFFMEYMTIIVYIAYLYSLKENQEIPDYIIMSVFITGLSIMRMEGALNAGVLVLCIFMLSLNSKKVCAFLVCPVFVLQALYLYRIFFLITLHTEIQFMTKEKAYILLAFLICIMLYALIIRGRFFVKLERYYALILIGGLIAVNVIVLLYDRSDYITNLKAFIGNLLRNSGWGLFVPVALGVIILIPKKSIKINYFDYTVICYILLTLVAGWARGDALYESFGDSGNRIMIQVAPLIIFALIVKIIEGFRYWEKEKLS